MYGKLGSFAAGSAGSASAFFFAGMHVLGLIVTGTTLLSACLSATKLLPQRWVHRLPRRWRQLLPRRWR